MLFGSHPVLIALYLNGSSAASLPSMTSIGERWLLRAASSDRWSMILSQTLVPYVAGVFS